MGNCKNCTCLFIGLQILFKVHPQQVILFSDLQQSIVEFTHFTSVLLLCGMSFWLKKDSGYCWQGALSKIAEASNGEDKKCTRLSELKLVFLPSCSWMRLQLLHFQDAFTMLWTLSLWDLMSVLSFSKRRQRQLNFSQKEETETNQILTHKTYKNKISKIYFYCLLVLPSSFAQCPQWPVIRY